MTGFAVSSFYKALVFARPNFRVSHERDFIMGKIFEALQCPEVETRVIAMQTLADIGKQEYEFIEFYFSQICEVTSNLATSDEDAVGA